jgi:hypothetical protein
MLAACAEPIETRPVTAQLEPMPERAAIPGDTIVWQRGDETVTWAVSSVANGLVTNESSGGCVWVVESQFAPSKTWQNCDPFADGQHTYTVKGTVFPLEVGKSMVYDNAGTNQNGDSWENTRTCTVEGTAQVEVPAGTFDTYQVTCDDGNTRRTFFMAPTTGTPVMYERLRRRQNERLLYKLVSFTPGA